MSELERVEADGVDVVPARRTVVTALPLRRAARERLSQLLGARVIDMRTVVDDADLVLSPSASPQLLGRLRNLYPSARIVVAELEDWEFDVDLTGPVTRLLRGGADAYVVADSLEDLAHKLGAPATADRPASPEHSMPMELHAANPVDDLLATFLDQAEQRTSINRERPGDER